MDDLFSAEKPLQERVENFVRNWKTENKSERERPLYQILWIDLADLFAGTHKGLEFEKETVKGGFSDVYSQKYGFIVEQKKPGMDLDKPESRGAGKPKLTPFEQAREYHDDLPDWEKVPIIVTSNFDVFRFYDLDTPEGLNGRFYAECSWEEMPQRLDLFERLFKEGEKPEEGFSILDPEGTQKIADKIDGLYQSLRKGIEEDPDLSEEDRKKYEDEIPLIIMRIVFLLFANSTSDKLGAIFPNHDFESFLDGTDGSRLSSDLMMLFKCLNIKDRRDRALAGIRESLRSFPYVDGELFSSKDFNGEEINTFPAFPASVYGVLKDFVLGTEDWDRIDISVFGMIMDQAFKGEYRRENGMYNTSRENIQKVIEPLFMSHLRAELSRIEKIENYEEKQKRLKCFHEKLGSLQFFDPACGSGAFLIESFWELRNLEDDVIELENETAHDLDQEVKVSLSQFHGIELDKYAAMIARTSLYIAREQALKRSYSRFRSSSLPPRFLPLKYEVQGIVGGKNSLETDWGEIVKPSAALYVFGNPPYRGYSNMDNTQKKDLKSVWGRNYCGRFDYCTAWLYKAADFLNGSGARFSFVTTSSIVEGNQVTPLFEPIFNMGWKIFFAYPPFKWDRPKVSVAAVIAGMAQDCKPPYHLWDKDSGECGAFREVENISQYLDDLPTVFVKEEKNIPISNLPECHRGGIAADNGGLVLENESAKAEADKDSVASKYVLPYFGAEQLSSGKKRWCLWITPEIYERDGLASQIERSKFLKNRLEIVRKYRLKSTKAATRCAAATPYCFQEIVEPTSHEATLAIPEVFTPIREYFAAGFLPQRVVFSNKLYVIEESKELAFSVVESAMFKSWQDLVGGRFGLSHNFGNTQVWNTFPFPDITDNQRNLIIERGADVLTVRSEQKKKGVTLRRIYDPQYMPPSLRKAHEKLDKAVDALFTPKKFLTKGERWRVLLEAYQQMTSKKEG